MARTEHVFTMPRRTGKDAMHKALRQAHQRGYLDGQADGYRQAMDEFCSPRRVVSEALLSVVAVLAVILLLASRWGAF